MTQQTYKYDEISTDASEVIKAQLVENTGKHLLDSGDAYGRHWQQNQDNPPWERPAYIVSDGYVVHNVYHYLNDNVSRNQACIDIERALHAFAFSDEYRNEGWRVCIDDFVNAIHNHGFDLPFAEDLDDDALETLYIFADEIEPKVSTWNTYNQEVHTLTQCILGHDLGGLYGEYVAVQIHNGADVRGGYTAPRIYQKRDEILYPMEFSYNVNDIDWYEAESTLYDATDLLYQPTVDEDEMYEFIMERADPDHLDNIPADSIKALVRDLAQRARNDEYVQGAVWRHEDAALYRVDVF